MSENRAAVELFAFVMDDGDELVLDRERDDQGLKKLSLSLRSGKPMKHAFGAVVIAYANPKALRDVSLDPAFLSVRQAVDGRLEEISNLRPGPSET